MGANAQTSVPTFTAGEVLTAANMNISARTGVPVFADTTARDAGFGGTGEKTLAEGQLCYLESTNVVQYYDGAAWATVGPTTVTSAFTRIGGGTLSGATTAFTNAFSTTYRVYMVTGHSVTGSNNSSLTVKLGSSATGYYFGRSWTGYNGSADLAGTSNGSTWDSAGYISTTNSAFILYFVNPFEAVATHLYAFGAAPATTSSGGAGAGWHNSAASYTDFTLGVGTGTFAGGTVNIYGLALS